MKPATRALGIPWLSWRVFRRTATTVAEARGLPLSDRNGFLNQALGPSQTDEHIPAADGLVAEVVSRRVVGFRWESENDIAVLASINA